MFRAIGALHTWCRRCGGLRREIVSRGRWVTCGMEAWLDAIKHSFSDEDGSVLGALHDHVEADEARASTPAGFSSRALTSDGSRISTPPGGDSELPKTLEAERHVGHDHDEQPDVGSPRASKQTTARPGAGFSSPIGDGSAFNLLTPSSSLPPSPPHPPPPPTPWFPTPSRASRL